MSELQVAIACDGPRVAGHMVQMIQALRPRVAVRFFCINVAAETPGSSARSELHDHVFAMLCLLENLIAPVAGKRRVRGGAVNISSLFNGYVECAAPSQQTAYDVVINFSGLANERLMPRARIAVLSSNVLGCDKWLGFDATHAREPGMEFHISMRHVNAKTEQVLIRGRLQTHLTFLENRAQLAAHVGHYLGEALTDIASGTVLRTAADGAVPVKRSRPSTGQVLRHATAVYSRTCKKVLMRLAGKRNRWQVRADSVDWKASVLSVGSVLRNAPDCFSADPFIWRKGDKLYCFVEEFSYRTGKGTIVCHAMRDGRFERLGTALEENFHISFPFIFEFRDELYMCPETYGAGDIRLYKCVEFPLRWKLEKILVPGIAAVDSVMFCRGGRWWLLTCVNPLGTGSEFCELRLYFADSPLAETWLPHTLNPILIDQVTVRNAGLFVEGDRLYRVNQLQAYDAYGVGARINEIVALDTDAYAEHALKSLAAAGIPEQVGLHHYSQTEVAGDKPSERWCAYDVSFYH